MKIQEVKFQLESYNYKATLHGAKDFRIGISDEQRSTMRRAYECFIRPEFYKSIGKNPEKCIIEGISVLKAVLG